MLQTRIVKRRERTKKKKRKSYYFSYLPRHSIRLFWIIQLTHREKAIRFPLRGRFNPQWFTLYGNPRAFGDPGFHRKFRYSCQHSHFWYLQVLSPKTFPDWQNVPLLTLEKEAFKVSSLRWITWALIHFRCHGARPVSYYAFFKGWLLPSPPPGCHRSITSFSTKWLLRDLSVRSGLFPSRLWILAPQKSVCTNDLGLYSEFPWGW